MEALSQSEIRRTQFSQSNPRYFVPDLSPLQRPALAKMKPRYIFVAESPHLNEVEPDLKEARRPLCGKAGREWWGLLSELKEGVANSDVSLERFLSFCQKHGIVMMNAVQSPLDPKVAARFPEADPAPNLGFNKVAGAYSYKKLKNSPTVRAALSDLAARLNHSALAGVPIYCLGNDALWFVSQALGEDAEKRIQGKIPHPSAWWRSGGLYGRVAREKLQQIFEI